MTELGIPIDSNQTQIALNDILNDIEKGLPGGARYSAAPNVSENRAVWKVVQKHSTSKSEHLARQIIKAWKGSGLLYEEEYDDPVQRKTRKGLFVDNRKRPGPVA